MKKLLPYLLASAAWAAPQIAELQPRGAQQGKTFTLTLVGRELMEGSRLESSLPAVFTPLTPTMKGLPFLVELKADAPVGTYPVRVHNANGLSNILLFTVGAFPETEEQELADHANDTPTAAQAVKSTPVTINGTLKGADRDFYRVSVRPGERRVFEVEARRCGSAIDPVLAIYDDKGNQIARNEDAPNIGVDARIDHTFTRGGDYFVEIHDARFSKQEQNFYRLKIGDFAYPEAVFPLGGQRGATVPFEFISRGGRVTTSVQLPKDGTLATVRMPGSPTIPLTVAVGEYPEGKEPATLPVTLNGRIAKAGQMDRYPLRVTSGEALLFELQSRELGASRLDALITIRDAQGKKLASAGDLPPVADIFSAQLVGRTAGDPFLNFKVPPETTEISVTIEDLAQRGGDDFGYRLTIRRQAEDFLLSANPAFVNVPRGGTASIIVAADRRGYDGPIHATVANLPKGWTAEGGFIPPETMDETGARSASRRGVLTVSAALDAEPASGELIVAADAKLRDGSTLHRVATGPGTVIDIANGTGLPDASSTDRQKAFTAPWLNLTTPAATGKEPSATITVKSLRRVRMAEGDAFDFEWTIAAKDKTLVMPANVAADAPGARDLRIIDMKPRAKGAPAGTFRITTTKATAPATYDLVVTANLMVDGQRETIVSRAIPFEVTEGTTSDQAAKVSSGSN